MMIHTRAFLSITLALAFLACDDNTVNTSPGDTTLDQSGEDTAPADTAPQDSGEDTAPEDTGPQDTGPADTGEADTANADTQVEDTSDAEDTFVDPTGDRCNDAILPCPTGWVCEEGACALDCGSNARCEELCCEAGQVCYLGTCTSPGVSCTNTDPLACGAVGQCPEGEQCDPSIGNCMPLPTLTSCEYQPTANFSPELLWSWTGSSAEPAYGHAIATPAVADINGDGVSDVIVPVTQHIPGTPTVGGILCALSGAGDCQGGPRELWCTASTDPQVNWVASPAVADLENTGQLTIIVGDARNNGGGRLVNGIAGYDVDGQRIAGFGTDSSGTPVDINLYVGAPGVADLDNDGKAEVYAAFTVFDSQGKLLWQRPSDNGNGGFGAITIAVDLDGDDDLELVGGNMAYHHDGTEAWTAGAAARSAPDGWPAVADFDGNGTPEIVTVANSGVRIFNANGSLYSTSGATIAGRGGPPTIADMNGDGTPDIAVAGADSLTVFTVGSDSDHTLSTLWTTASNDFSSNFTGSSVFDFDGDGRTEVIYGDECFARVYDGPGDGQGGTTVRFEVPNTSCTGVEYPVVADVTGDGKAEFIVVANNAEAMNTACSPYATACRTRFSGYEPNNGVRVYRDANDNWVATRAIWNQHAYHITNVCDGRDSICSTVENRHAAIPSQEPPSHAFPSGAPLNSYRVNAQVDGVFNAPDLLVRGLRANLLGCPSVLEIVATVTNLGALGVPANTPVAFYLVDGNGGRTLLGVERTSLVLLPGGSQTLRLTLDPLDEALRNTEIIIDIVVDDDGTGAGSSNECDETNNTATMAITCSAIN